MWSAQAVELTVLSAGRCGFGEGVAGRAISMKGLQLKFIVYQSQNLLTFRACHKDPSDFCWPLVRVWDEGWDGWMKRMALGHLDGRRGHSIFNIFYLLILGIQCFCKITPGARDRHSANE